MTNKVRVCSGKAALPWIQALLLPLLLFTLLAACHSHPQPEEPDELSAFEAFFASKGDSISIAPRRLRTECLRRMETVTDSLVRCHYMAVASKTCLITSDIDSARLLLNGVEEYIANRPFSPVLADLQSDCANMRGNILGRLGEMKASAEAFEEAYEWRMKGRKKEVIPDILINLADVNNRLGRLDVGAYWYRRALLLCDSLQLTTRSKTPVYYGLAQVYVALRDFEQCDHYYELAARSYEEMLPYERHFYLNNRGTSYYYRNDYLTAIGYFRRVVDLVQQYPEMEFERNLAYLNLSDCFLQMGAADSAATYLRSCKSFFRKLGMSTAIYYIDTQQIELALLRKDFQKVRQLLASSVTPPDIDPDMVYIRNKYLLQFCEETGNYHQAWHYLKANKRLDDSVRNERVRLRTADLALRYQQDSTLMANRVVLQEAENEVLRLRQTKGLWIALFVVTLLVVLSALFYMQKKKALLMAENRRQVSNLRLENIRNRLSPHFIFNVLNQQMANLGEEEKHELSSLVKLMRRNLELAEQFQVTLSEELEFVDTYINLERRSLGDAFFFERKIAQDVNPEQVWLPSMLLQIPVENAVKHALRDKSGDRRLWIEATRVAEGVTIRITDNGGGYRMSSTRRGTGTGMKVIMQTIQILNSKNRQAIDVSLHNVTLDNGEVGCQVTFLLPSDYDYRL
ncbi:MAG: histidine kinase [Bacteroides sp.]|nr:histidine kinase [Bacteroides sp.]